MDKLGQLENLAKAATPGPWVKHDTMPNGSAEIWASFPCINGLSAYFTIARIDTPGDDEVGYTEGAINSHQTIANAEFIAAANPATIASLTEAVRVLSEALEGMTTAFRPFTLRPIGAEGSQVRIEQEEQHAAHTAARAALTTAKEILAERMEKADG